MHLVEIVVSMPFESVCGNTDLVSQAPNELRDGAWFHRIGIGNAESHRIAQTDLHLQMVRHLFTQPFEFLHEGKHETRKISPRHILQMTAGAHSGVERRFDDFNILIHRLLAGLVLFVKDVVV